MTAPVTERPAPAPRLFPATVAALCETLIIEACHGPGGPPALDCAPTVNFVLLQCGRMPDYLRLPMRVMTLLFAGQVLLITGTRFHKLPHPARWRCLAAWKQSRLGFRRDFVRFYESLSVLGWYSLQKDS